MKGGREIRTWISTRSIDTKNRGATQWMTTMGSPVLWCYHGRIMNVPRPLKPAHSWAAT